jgi:hypothetical protein
MCRVGIKQCCTTEGEVRAQSSHTGSQENNGSSSDSSAGWVGMGRKGTNRRWWGQKSSASPCHGPVAKHVGRVVLRPKLHIGAPVADDARLCLRVHMVPKRQDDVGVLLLHSAKPASQRTACRGGTPPRQTETPLQLTRQQSVATHTSTHTGTHEQPPPPSLPPPVVLTH